MDQDTVCSFLQKLRKIDGHQKSVKSAILHDDQFAPQAAREAKMTDLWLECYTQQEIGDAVGVDQMTVQRFVQDLLKIDRHQKSVKSAILHDDFGVAGAAEILVQRLIGVAVARSVPENRLLKVG